MKTLLLESVQPDCFLVGSEPVDADDIGDDLTERSLYFDDGRRIQITPRLPVMVDDLELYLSKIGCPPDVVAAVVSNAVEVFGGWVAKSCEFVSLGVNCVEDNEMRLILAAADYGRCAGILIKFRDS